MKRTGARARRYPRLDSWQTISRCPLCGKFIESAKGLRKHFAAKHQGRSVEEVQDSKKEKCEACDEPVASIVRVQFDYMRGNDGFFKVCERHRRLAQNRKVGIVLKDVEETSERRKENGVKTK